MELKQIACKFGSSPLILSFAGLAAFMRKIVLWD